MHGADLPPSVLLAAMLRRSLSRTSRSVFMYVSFFAIFIFFHGHKNLMRFIKYSSESGPGSARQLGGLSEKDGAGVGSSVAAD